METEEVRRKVLEHLLNIIKEFNKDGFHAARNRLIDYYEFWEGDLCEKCGGMAQQISKGQAEQEHKGFDLDAPIIKCFFCHHEFEPF